MTDDNRDQKPLSEIEGSDNSPAPIDTSTGSSPPSPENPAEFLTWLQNRDGVENLSPENAVSELIDQALHNDHAYYSISAEKAISLILEQADSPVNVPELVNLLGTDHVKLSPLLTHLDAIFPDEDFVSVTTAGSAILEDVSESSIDRSEAFRILSKLPPDENIYETLAEWKSVSDLEQWFKNYALRCLEIYLEHSDHPCESCATKAMRHYPTRAFEIISDYPEMVFELEIKGWFKTLVKQTRQIERNKDSLSSDPHVKAYLSCSSPEKRNNLGELVEITLKAGIKPKNLDDYVDRIFDLAKAEDGNIDGSILAAIFASAPENTIEQTTIDRVVNSVVNEDNDKLVSSLKVLAADHPEMVSNRLDELNAFVNGSKYNEGQILSEVITILSKNGPEYLFQYIGAIINLISDDANGVYGLILSRIFNAVPPHSISEEVIETVVFEVVDNGNSEFNESLATLAKNRTETVGEFTDEMIAELKGSGIAGNKGIVETLAELAKRDTGHIYPDIDPIVAELREATSSEEVDAVGKILINANIYPPPPSLLSLYDSKDERIEQSAKRITRELRSQFADSYDQIVPGDFDHLNGLAEEFTLVHRTGEITWEPVELTGSKQSVFENLATSISSRISAGEPSENALVGELMDSPFTLSSETTSKDRYGQVIFPTHDEEWVELSIVGVQMALLTQTDVRAVIHSPAKGGWGTKKDIKKSIQEYAIVANDDPTEVYPLLDLVPTSRINDGEIELEGTKSTNVSSNPPSVTLVRRFNKLLKTPADIVLCNYLPGIDSHNAAYIQDLRGAGHESRSEDETHDYSHQNAASLSSLIETEDVEAEKIDGLHPDDPSVVEMYSIFTAQYGEDRRQYIGPPVDLPDPILQVNTELSEPAATGSELHEVTDKSCLLREKSPLEIHSVKSEQDIGDLLLHIDSAIEQLADSDHISALQSFRYTVESLPVPVDLHDQWIQDQIDQGNRWVPRQVKRRVEGLERLAEQAGLEAQLIDETITTVETITERLQETNPLFEKLLDILDEAVSSNKQVGILVSKKNYKDMIDVYLSGRINDSQLGDNLLLLDEQSVRDITATEVDWLVSFGPLPPQTAIYYHHPAVEKAIIIGYADGTLEDRVSGIDRKRRPYLPEKINTDLPKLEIETFGVEVKTADVDASFTDDLYSTYLSVARQGDEGKAPSTSSFSFTRYRVHFKDKEAITLTNAHPVILKSDKHLVSRGEYIRRDISDIEDGDVIVPIDHSTRIELWEEFLRQDWEGDEQAEQAEEAFFDAVKLWYDAVETGLEAHADDSGRSSKTRNFAREIAPETTVELDTVIAWARSVDRADSPSDLVFQSDLRIGPRNEEGVKVVAKKYGNERMQNNWEKVFNRMKAIRTVHRQRGSVFWEWLTEQASAGELFDYPGVTEATVERISKVD